MTKSKINVARDFSKYPAGRYKNDGPASGEEFREKILLPTLQEGGSLTIELDGTRGYGSSFLEEAFGGAVRAGFPPGIVKSSFKLVSNDASLIEEIQDYIDHGSPTAEIARILFLLVFTGATVTLSPADKDTKEENKQ